ncbi:MAG: tRNA (adenine(22)-N(1))-methyltransferase TrmK [Desulfobacteraceae bacterium]|nr:tRNA (adenine(22)-N(1))-methyltransferase TrmK [Desulfobacteraceae bacterium]
MTKPCDAKKLILETLEASESRLTPISLIKTIVKKTGVSSASAKKTIKKLIAQKELAYTYFFGSTYIELSFNKPVKVTNRFILIPAGLQPTHNKNDINIFIDPGISFGSGRHPTTRLALMALDHAIACGKINQLKLQTANNLIGLDIGTGSGVLAIAACKTEISNCVALDIDPNSLAEAKKNVILNGLENKIQVSNMDIKTLKEKYSIILANLRYPTLKSIAKSIASLSQKGSLLIMSGIRTYEKNDLVTMYTNNDFNLFFEKDEKNWSCIAMQSGIN